MRVLKTMSDDELRQAFFEWNVETTRLAVLRIKTIDEEGVREFDFAARRLRFIRTIAELRGISLELPVVATVLDDGEAA